MSTKRLLTTDEIEYILDFIKPQKGIPKETSESIAYLQKEKLKKQLEKQNVYPEIIDELKENIEKNFYKSIIQPGEAVGVICAQSIGEKNTQTTLNSVDYTEYILFNENSIYKIDQIGNFIDCILSKNNTNIVFIEENRTQYLDITHLGNFFIPSGDKNGRVSWKRITAVTKHLPVGKLVKVKTKSGREVAASQSKSFLTWDSLTETFIDTLGSEIKIGDILPTTKNLPHFSDIFNHVDIRDVLSFDEIVESIDHSLSDYDISILSNEYNKSIENSNFFNHSYKIPLDNTFGYILGNVLLNIVYMENILFFTRHVSEIKRWLGNLNILCSIKLEKPSDIYYPENKSLTVHSKLFSSFILKVVKKVFMNSVPDFMFKVSDSFISGFIRGCSIGYKPFDFNYAKIFNGDNIEMEISVSDRCIGMYLSTVLSTFGIFCNFYRNYTLLIIEKSYVEDYINLLYNCKNTKNYVEKSTVYDVVFDPVIHISYVNSTNGFVYDLTVEDTRNFNLYNGLVVRDTFHSSGIANKQMTVGVPRFQELLNATADPANVNHKIIFKNKCETIKQLRDEIGDTIVSLKLKDIVSKTTIYENGIDKNEREWYDYFCILYGDNFSKYTSCISLNLNVKKIFELKVNATKIIEKIENEFCDTICVFSPDYSIIDVYVNTSDISLPEDRVLFINSENMISIYLEECVEPSLLNLHICGIEGITEIFFAKDDETNLWYAETNGVCSKTGSTLKYDSFKKLLSLKNVDEQKTLSNNMWDIYNTLGIEATREFLINEFASIMEGINDCHAKLLVDRMTYNGFISSITRYTLRKDEGGVLGKASFEESMDHFLNAAVQGQTDPIKGISSSIICGKRAEIGSGIFDVKLDMSKFIVGNVKEKSKTDN